jgi:hypothetical protein
MFAFVCITLSPLSITTTLARLSLVFLQAHSLGRYRASLASCPLPLTLFPSLFLGSLGRTTTPAHRISHPFTSNSTRYSTIQPNFPLQ